VFSVCALLSTTVAEASVSLCITTRADAADEPGLNKLVRSEVARHPSHHVVEKDCESHLVVESFATAGSRYLTVQLDGEVPERSTLARPEELADKLSRAVTAVLGNDPVYLAQDPARWNRFERFTHSVLVRGINTYRLEFFETAMRTNQNVAFAPGFALALARGADQWQVQARLHGAMSLSEIQRNELTLRVAAGMDAGVLYEASRRAATSGYVGAGAGLVLLRLEGLTNPEDRGTETAVDKVGATLNLRAGVRFLRLFDFDADVFAQANLPLFMTRETDDPLLGESGAYTPYLQLGVGIGF
jgi:hypothetical protein